MSMLNLMAHHQGAGHVTWPASLPLPLSCLPPADCPPCSPLLHTHPLHSLPQHSLRLRLHADTSVLTPPLPHLPSFHHRHHLVLPPRLPVYRNGSSSRTSRPLTSFCIRDILGRDADSAREECRPSSTRSDAVSPTSSCRSGEGDGEGEREGEGGRSRGLIGRDSLPKVRALSSSPFTPASTSGSPSPSPCAPRGGLSPLPGARKAARAIVRPWVPDPRRPHSPVLPDDGADDSALDDDDDHEEEEEEEISVDDDEPCPRSAGSRDLPPLDALRALTSKTLTGMHSSHCAESRRREQEALLFSRYVGPKRRRKSRTAFSNQQVHQLEKRFLFQKYLAPADRDHIAHTLGLSNAQVITWFQNRRAKLKRDLEELKNDVTAAKKHSVPRPAHSTAPDGPHPHPRHRPHHHSHHRRIRRPDRRADRRGGDGSASLSPTSSLSASSSSDLRPSSSLTSTTTPLRQTPSPGTPSRDSGGCGCVDSGGCGCVDSGDSSPVSRVSSDTENNISLQDSPVSESEDPHSSPPPDGQAVPDTDRTCRSGGQHCCLATSGPDLTCRVPAGAASSPPSDPVTRRVHQCAARERRLGGRWGQSGGRGRELVLCGHSQEDVNIFQRSEN
ncbi:uncharacterized protein LOC143279564 isoform X2 [Babylonia areolata]